MGSAAPLTRFTLGWLGLLEPVALSAQSAAGSVLQPVADVPLPGGTGRFDYQSLDPKSGRLYIAHMGAGRLVVFDTRRDSVVASVPGFPGVTGVLAVPAPNRVYASVTGRHELAVLDPTTLKVQARVGGIRFPDGIAYAAEAGKLFVSDEFGRRDVVVDAASGRRLGEVPLGGEAGNTQYDSVSKRIWVAVQTKNQLVAIDPGSDRVVGRYDLAGADHPHGLFLDIAHRLAFVACEGNARLLVVDLTTMTVTGEHHVGDDPDVLAFDPGLQLLYVASESGVVTVFKEDGGKLQLLGAYHAPAAHSVAVDPVTHRVYLPLKNVAGKPVLRILSPTFEQTQ
jgi:DNA-binding beta-propeller fold protein YncE